VTISGDRSTERHRRVALNATEIRAYPAIAGQRAVTQVRKRRQPA
jgi:hypothetical protein